MISEEEEEKEYVSEARLPASLQELTATYRDAETITGNVACIRYKHRETKLTGIHLAVLNQH